MSLTASPTLDEIETVARKAFAGLPDEFRALTSGVMFMLADFPDTQTLVTMRIKSRYGLLGLYHGAPLALQLSNQAGPEPTMIFLYREPILQYARSQDLPLEAVVRHVLVHEIGHHFGLSDGDMHAIEAAS